MASSDLGTTNNESEEHEEDLINAAKEGQTDKVQELLDHCIDINIQDRDKNTALHWAAMEGHNHTVDLLCKRGADVDIPNSDGSTALLVAAEVGHTKCVEVLLNYNANINKAALHWASLNFIPVRWLSVSALKYATDIQESWTKVDAPFLLLPFPQREDMMAAYYKLIIGCGKIEWNCIEKGNGFASFIINMEKDIQIIVYNDCTVKVPWYIEETNCLRMELYTAKTSDKKAFDRIPAVWKKLENAQSLQVKERSDTAPHVCPCLEENDSVILSACLIRCNELELKNGRFALAMCLSHKKIIAGDKIAVWFKSEEDHCDAR